MRRDTIFKIDEAPEATTLYDPAEQVADESPESDTRPMTLSLRRNHPC